MKKKFTALIVIGCIVLSSGSIILAFFLVNRSSDCGVTYVEGAITEDTTWCGLVHIKDTAYITENVTLTILPGPTVEFRHYRGYKEEVSVGLFVAGGTIRAIGTSTSQIWFTSDADEPINGDWAGISCIGTNNSVFSYVIVEFATIGIEQIDSSVEISHSIVRWVNTEGIYAEESHPLIEYNLIYGNAYHNIALEQHNYDVIIRNNIFLDSHYGIHSEASNVTIQANYFVNHSRSAITAGQYSNMTIIENKFENITEAPIYLDSTTTNTTLNNDFGSGTVTIPQLDFPNSKRIELGYIPGDLDDKYLYVYPIEDETRRTIKRVYNETIMGSALTYMNGSLWRFNLAFYTKGTFQDFVQIDTVNGSYIKVYGNNFIVNPRGLTHDGTYFWVNDFTLRKIFKFKVNTSDMIEIIDSFNVPNSNEGGLSSLTCNSSHLFSVSRDGTSIYQMDFSGSLILTIIPQGSPVHGSITWTSTYFWANSGNYLTKWHVNWTLAGKIYPPAWGTDALTWDGSYLWSLQKTCELWNDGKLFQMEIIDDQIIL